MGMTDNGDTVLREALALSHGDRAQVAADLIASLDDPHEDPSVVEAAWADEVERRARQVLADPGAGEPWEAVRERVAGNLRAE